MTNIQQKLTTTGDFLTLTQQNPFSLEPCSFILEKPQTQVNVLATGVIVFEPQEHTNKDIILSCAVHGNETAPIEICQDLVKAILLEQIEVKHRVMFLFANPESINIGERFVEENMNRLFSGAHSEGEGKTNPERVRAAELEQFVEDFFLKAPKTGGERTRYHYDLHTAIRGAKYDKFAVYPFLHGKAHDKEQLSFLNACGVNTILFSGSATTTFSYFSSNNFDAHAFTVELGKVRPFGENKTEDFIAARTSFENLLTDTPLNLKAFDEQDFHLFEISQVINRTQEDFKLHFGDDELNFTSFDLGYCLASDGDIDYTVEQEGEAIIFPNAKVALGQRALLTVVPTSLK